jgi:hypothetical protein
MKVEMTILPLTCSIDYLCKNRQTNNVCENYGRENKVNVETKKEPKNKRKGNWSFHPHLTPLAPKTNERAKKGTKNQFWSR